MVGECTLDDFSTMPSAVRPLLKLHLGAFNCGIDGWINTDVTPHLWVARIPFAAWALRQVGIMNAERLEEHRAGRFAGLRYMDLTRPLPLADESVSAVFSSHVFEHLFPDEVERLMLEIHRVLTPGGICRVVVPDLEKIVAVYDVDKPQDFVKRMFETERRADLPYAHHGGFTKPYLRSLFVSAGFSEAGATEYRQGRCPDLDRLDNRPIDSIFFEAVK
jgi:SAM-dependent methyltransferase